DLMEVALAAVKLAHEAQGAPTEEEIPEISEKPARAVRGDTSGRDAGGRGPRRQAGRDGLDARLFLGVGRRAGIRPQDLVGAIAGESGLSGRDIGSIEISDRFSLVEVPESAVDEVVAALRRSTIKGKKVTVRRDREPGRPRRTRPRSS
ncbi:MAG: DbpA RNA binding domain-containing protein, partial [Micromonosporaceae bacterium]